LIALPITCPVFIGRRDELEVLNDARRGLSKSRGAFVLLGGEAGVGKSRLLSHFVLHTGDRRVRNLATAECRQDIVEPLGPIFAIVESLLAAYVPDDLPPSAQRALGRIAPELASAYGRDAAAGQIDRTDFHAGLASLLIAFATKRATILAVEDIHWADPSTLDFLAFLARHVENTRLFVVATHRTEGLDANPPLLAALTRIEREPAVRRVVLEPFAGSELRSFVTAALGDRAAIDGASFERIVARSEGNAFYAEELLKDALSSGSRPDPRLPISIRGTIVLRLQAFDEFERRVMSHAAVLGLRFDPILLAAVLECHVDDVLPALQRARDAAILVEDPEDQALLRFRHALTRQVIYDDILAFDRRRLHTRILETLEGSDPGATGNRLYVLAEHAAAARDASRTLMYGERAGSAAWALGAFPEAIICFERALEAASDDADRARLMQLLAFPVSHAGDPLRAVRLWEDALAIRVRLGHHPDAATLHQMIICERFNLGDIDDEGESALAYIARHREHVPSRTRDSVYVLVANLRSEFCHIDGIDDVLENVEDADALAPSVKQNVFRTQLNRAAYFGRVTEWRSALERLTALSPLHENPSIDALNVVDHLGTVVASGTYLNADRDIIRALERGRSILRDWGFEAYVRYYDALEAAYLSARGNLGAARLRFQSAAEDHRYLSSAILARTAPFLALSLDDDAFVGTTITAETIERERAKLRANAASQYSRLLLGGYAIWLERRGRNAEATTYLAEAFEAIPYPSPRFTPLLTFALRHLGSERIPGLEQFTDAERLAPDDVIGRATASFAVAALARRAGDEIAALAGFRHAAATYEAFGFPIDAAHAYHFAGDGDAARSLYLRSGAVAYAREAPVAEKVDASEGWPLSEREQTVAEFVTLGMTNVEIGERMSISTKTVEKFLASIFRKLGLRSRSQIAARLVTRDMHAASSVPR
jgi:DNA-binding CsgD family transcriptional regulator